MLFVWTHFASGQLPHLAEAPFPQHSQEGEVAELDFIQAAAQRLARAGVIGLVDHLFSWA